MSPALIRPRPTSTSVPVIARTIWWQERVGADLEPQERHAERVVGPPRSTAPSAPGAPGSPGAPRRAASGDGRTRAKSCSPTSGSAGQLQHGEVERLRARARRPAPAADGRRACSAPCSGSAASVALKRALKSSATQPGRAARSSARTSGSRGAPRRRGRSPAGRSSEITWPQPCTPASVRPAPVSSTGVADDARHRLGERAGDGRDAVVGGEAVEARGRRRQR